MADTKMSWAIRPLEFSQTTATGKPQSASSIRSMAADHEAAHAVVGIRLEMKLVKIDIAQRRVTLSTDQQALLHGVTRYDVADLEVVEGLTEVLLRRILFAAAPIIVEKQRDADVPDVCRNDIAGVMRWSAPLGLTFSQTADVLAWAANTAYEILTADGGHAWRSVAAELRKHRFLSPAKVVSLVRDSDQRWNRQIASEAQPNG